MLPLGRLAIGASAVPSGPQFQRVKSSADLDQAMANSGGRTVMLDFYADWCVSCKEMERFTFRDDQVKTRLAKLILLQADVTANDSVDSALLKRFGLFGPPGILFFKADGTEIRHARVIGFKPPAEFVAKLDQVDGAR